MGLMALDTQELRKAEPLVPEPSVFDVQLAIEKLNFTNHQVLIRTQHNWLRRGVEQFAMRSIKFISIWNEEELPEGWNESIIVPIYKKGSKADCDIHRGISFLPTMYKILSNILMSKLTPHAEEIIGDHQCGLGRNLSTDHIFCIRQILKKNGNTMKQCMRFISTSR